MQAPRDACASPPHHRENVGVQIIHMVAHPTMITSLHRTMIHISAVDAASFRTKMRRLRKYLRANQVPATGGWGL